MIEDDKSIHREQSLRMQICYVGWGGMENSREFRLKRKEWLIWKINIVWCDRHERFYMRTTRRMEFTGYESWRDRISYSENIIESAC